MFVLGVLDYLYKFDFIIDLVWLIFLFIFFVLLNVLLVGVLNSFYYFVLLVLVLVIFNVCMIVGVLWLVLWL